MNEVGTRGGRRRVFELVAPDETLPHSVVSFHTFPLLLMAVLAREGSLHSLHNGTAASSPVS